MKDKELFHASDSVVTGVNVMLVRRKYCHLFHCFQCTAPSW